MVAVTNLPHRALCEELLWEIETKELPWYEKEAAVNLYWWVALALTGFILPIITSVLAAFQKGGNMSGIFVHIPDALIILPAITSIAVGIMSLLKLSDNESLREYGRIEIRDILLDAKSLIASAATEEEYRAAYHAIRKRLINLEIQQHKANAAFRAEKSLKDAQSDGDRSTKQ